MAFDPPAGWRFFPLEDRIVGRPVDVGMPGVLNLMVLRGPDLPPQLSHEACMAATRAAVKSDLPASGFDRARDVLDDCVAGGESFLTKHDFVRAWYHQCCGSFVVGWFGCPAERIKERRVQRLIGQCDLLVASIRIQKS
jgi:hypothetical protein